MPPSRSRHGDDVVRRYRPAAVWLTGLALYAGDFVVKRIPLWRPPLDVSVGVDAQIPFLPGWAWVYLLAWFVFIFGAAGWYLRTHWEEWPDARALLFAALVMQFGGWAMHVLVPTYMPRPPLGPDSGWLIAHIYATDPPTHVLPSLHLASVVVAGWFLARRASVLRVVLAGAFVGLVALSVLFTKQHGLLDVVTGAAWGYGACQAGVRLSAWVDAPPARAA